MTKTYYIKYELLGEIHFDKVTHKSIEERPRWHKVEALNKWKETHKGYGWMRIDHVFTKEEMKINGYL